MKHLEKMIFIISLFMFSYAEAALTKKTLELNKQVGEARKACAEEIAKTGSEGANCTKYRNASKEYVTYYRENECQKLGNKDNSMCKWSEEEIYASGDKRLENTVNEYKRELAQEAAQEAAKKQQEEQQAAMKAAQEAAKKQSPDIVGMTSGSSSGSKNTSSTGASRQKTTSSNKSKTTSTSSGISGSGSSKAPSGLFGTLLQKGAEIFAGMREIIFAVAGFGITAVAIGGFFGNLNWKWLSSIIIGLIVISTTSAIINYMVDSDVTSGMITDTLISGN